MEGMLARHDRQFEQLVAYNQALLARAEAERARYWSRADASSLAAWQASCEEYRRRFWEEVLGKLPAPTEPPRPRTRRLQETRAWTSYEVVLDVYPEVFCWGILLVPHGIAEGERRPVVVCQHGLEGLPEDVVTQDRTAPAWPVYHGFAAALAERGFVTYAPHNPYRGGNAFRQLQRKLHPLKKTLFSVIVAQHQQHLAWLASLPFVDPRRIAFYGLSYGGFTAVRVPPLLEGYALSISSAEFNDMLRKKASTRDRYSYPFYGTYEVFEFNLANTYGYGELAALMAPRPFMVERGHEDGVAPDEWVAAEYARVRRRYVQLGIGDRTEIEFFAGGHEIHGEGTYRFLHRHLRWPEPESAP
jgi:cephalosporin-C deacetylase-like acetyl esterase